MLTDFRFAFRRLMARRAFFAVAILSLGLGIGAITVFFGFLNATLLKSLPISRPSEVFSFVNARNDAPSHSYPNYLDFRNGAKTFDLSLYNFVRVSASFAPGSSQRLWGNTVAGNYFQLLGVKAAMGRTLSPDDDLKRGAHPVAVLTYGAWRRHLGSNPDVIGRKIKINGMDYTVVGVAEKGFNGVERIFQSDIFIPIAMTSQVQPGATFLDQRDSEQTFLISRLRPGVTPEHALSEANAIATRIASQHPESNEGYRIRLVEPGWAGDFLRGGVTTFSVALLVAAIIILFVVCVNLAGILSADASERRKETAIRLAVGASRIHLIRQLLAESLLLAASGAALGLTLAWWGIEALNKLTPPIDISFNTVIEFDYRVLFFSIAVTLATGLILGLAPAWQATRTDLQLAMKKEVADPRKRRLPLRDILIGIQVALSVLLLATSGLMLRSLQNSLDIPLGFKPSSAAVIGIDPSLQGYDKTRQAIFQKTILDRLRALPGIESVGVADALP